MNGETPDPRHPTDTGRVHSHRGWHSRGYLPHFDSAEAVQNIVFRLHDSVPAEVVAKCRAELRLSPEGPSNRCSRDALWRKLDRYADTGHGCCWLRDSRIAAIVENALLQFDGVRYRLFEWCIMPNHVHVLIECAFGHPLDEVIQAWKGYTSHEANRILGRRGHFWSPDYYDRFIRDDRHLQAVRNYIRANPVGPGLCATAEDWPWGSARRRGVGNAEW